MMARVLAPSELANSRNNSGVAGAPVWMAAAFLISLVVAAITLGKFGAGEHGIAQALRATARWCFALFWPAYVGGALARFGGPRFAALARLLARHGREFGLAFAAALAVHIALVLWLLHVATRPQGLMLVFWVGVLCTCALALFSLPRLRDMLGPRLWRLLTELALHYIALVFAVDFIVEPLRAGGPGRYPQGYLPFAVTLIGAAALRLAAHAQRRPLTEKA